MSIASEIEDLNTNLTAAKNAVTTKGGTVGDTGLAGLASEIASIPAGGGGIGPLNEYGRVVYYSDFSKRYVPEGMMCIVTVTNQETFDEFCEEAFSESGGWAQIRFEEGTWFYDDMSTGDRVEIPDITAIGITVVFEEPDPMFAEIMVHSRWSYNVDGPIESVELASSDLSCLVNTSDDCYTINGVSIYTQAVLAIYLGSSITSLPNYFMTGASNLSVLDVSAATNLTTIGNSVHLYNKNAIEFPSVTSVGTYFTADGSVNFPALTAISTNMTLNARVAFSFPEVLTVGNSFTANSASKLTFAKATSIGNNFKATQCQEIYLPQVQTIGTYFMENADPVGGTLTLSMTSVTTIGNWFLKKYRGRYIYSGHANYQGLRLPSTLTMIGASFLYEANNFVGKVYADCPAYTLPSDRHECFCGHAYSLSELELLPIRAIGFQILGDYSGAWQTALPTEYYQYSSTNYVGRKSRS